MRKIIDAVNVAYPTVVPLYRATTPKITRIRWACCMLGVLTLHCTPPSKQQAIVIFFTSRFDINGDVLGWLADYLNGRSQVCMLPSSNDSALWCSSEITPWS